MRKAGVAIPARNLDDAAVVLIAVTLLAIGDIVAIGSDHRAVEIRGIDIEPAFAVNVELRGCGCRWIFGIAAAEIKQRGEYERDNESEVHSFCKI